MCLCSRYDRARLPLGDHNSLVCTDCSTTFIVLDLQKQQFKHIFANKGAGLYFKYNADPSTSDLMKHFNTG